MPHYRQSWDERTLPSYLDPDWLAEIQLPPLTESQITRGLYASYEGSESDKPETEDVHGLDGFADHIAKHLEYMEDERIFEHYYAPGVRIRQLQFKEQV